MWPVGWRSPLPSSTVGVSTNYGAFSLGCPNADRSHYFTYYIDGRQEHLGLDLRGDVGTVVYAVAGGRVVDAGKLWGDYWKGVVLVEHRASNGQKFTAAYGHIVIGGKPGAGRAWRSGDAVTRGSQLGQIAPLYGSNHLHFGIAPGVQTSVAGLSATAGTGNCVHHSLGTVDPTPFLRARNPASSGSSPRGRLDSAIALTGNRIRVRGWAFDPDSAKHPVVVEAWIDGPRGKKGARKVSLGFATLKRPDVARVHKEAGSRHGFDKTIGRVKPGKRTVRLYALNRFKGGGVKLLGARTVRVPRPLPVVKRVAFDTSYGINVVGANGSGLRLIVPKRGAGEPRWSPDGRWIVYVKHTYADRMRIGPSIDPRSIWLVRPNGTGDRRLVGPNAYAAAWSPDGREVRFLRRSVVGEAGAVGEVQAVNIATGKIRSLGMTGPTYVSPDGRFAQDTDYGGIRRTDGGALDLPPRRGVYRTFYDLPGGFSPRGKIPYNCYEGGSGRTDLCIVNPNTGKYTHLITPRGLWEYQGAYSPSGKTLAVTGRDGLFVVPSSGSRSVRWLMKNPGLGGSNTPFNPTWEP